MKLSFHSQFLKNNTCLLPNFQKTFQQYRINSGRHVRHIEQLQQSLADRFVGFNKDKALLRTFGGPFEAS
jgi:hypothetical protein